MDRAQWLEARRKGIGSSDVAAICGISPWKTALHVYDAKMSEEAARADADQIDVDDPRGVGIVIEPSIAQMYSIKMGKAIKKAPTIERHKSYPWMLASCDYEWVEPDEEGLRVIVECKNSARRDGWGKAGTDEVPSYYYVQAQHQMEVTGAEVVHFAVLFGGNDFEIYEVHRNPEVIYHLTEMEHSFWEMCKKATPPDPDYTHPETPELLKMLYSKVEPVEVSLPDVAQKLVDEFFVHQNAEKEAGAKKEAVKARLQAMMGNGERAVLPDGSTVKRILKVIKEYVCPSKRYVEMKIAPPSKAKAAKKPK